MDKLSFLEGQVGYEVHRSLGFIGDMMRTRLEQGWGKGKSKIMDR